MKRKKLSPAPEPRAETRLGTIPDDQLAVEFFRTVLTSCELARNRKAEAKNKRIKQEAIVDNNLKPG